MHLQATMAYAAVICSYQLAQKQLQMDRPAPDADAPLFWVHARSAYSTRPGHWWYFYSMRRPAHMDQCMTVPCSSNQVTCSAYSSMSRCQVWERWGQLWGRSIR